MRENGFGMETGTLIVWFVYSERARHISQAEKSTNGWKLRAESRACMGKCIIILSRMPPITGLGAKGTPGFGPKPSMRTDGGRASSPPQAMRYFALCAVTFL